VSVEGGRELGEEGADAGRVEVEEEEGAAEEKDDLPGGDEGVGEVAALLLTLLDPAQLADEAPRRTAVDKVLPPAGGNEEYGDGNGPTAEKITRTLNFCRR
jgi:hypothetical protein